jgi:hypothetical protein
MKITAVPSVICLLTFGAVAGMAQTLTCTFQFIASGTLGTQTFTNAAITITTTANRQPKLDSRQYSIVNDSVSISISEVGTFQFTAPDQTQITVVNTGLADRLPPGVPRKGSMTIDFHSIGGFSIFADAFHFLNKGWMMSSSLGPLRPWVYRIDGSNRSAVMTDGGTLNLYDVPRSTDQRLTFQATVAKSGQTALAH